MSGIDPALSQVEAAADLCSHGCYWDCEHRAPAPPPDDRFAMAGALLPVHDDDGRALGRCRDCGGMFYALLDHAREHERLRQLGLLPSPDILLEAARMRRSRSAGDARGDAPGASIEDR